VDAAGDPPDEPAQLTHFGPSARTAGACVPTLLAVERVRGQTIMTLRGLDGRAAALLLADHPGLTRAVIELVADWLEAWNRATTAVRVLHLEYLRRELLSPAEELAPLLACGKAYLEWLAARCPAWRGPAPLVAAHNDLSTWNLLLDDGGQLGVVDWAE